MTDNNNFLFVGNGPYTNRGCEAIIRGTVKILRAAFGESQFANFNFNIAHRATSANEEDKDISHNDIHLAERGSIRWLASQMLRRASPTLNRMWQYGTMNDALGVSRAVLSVGGDNYTLDYGIPRTFLDLNRHVIKHDKPLIIWGASLGPFDHRPDFAKIMHAHLQDDVSAIFVRERRSQTYLQQHGIAANVYLMADPAFVMDSEPVTKETMGFTLPQGTIGLNLSPILGRRIFGGNQRAWHDNCAEIIRMLKDRLDRPILLVPHVTSIHDNDYELLQKAKSLSGNINEVYMMPDNLSAQQSKWVISKLDCMIAARTHATIASFSSCVPTVSLAYSVKAWGINEMIFDHTDYVVDLTKQPVDQLIKTVNNVLDQNKTIREHLHTRIPILQNMAMEAGNKMKEIINKY